jgi:hypothetical protein
MKKIDSSQRVGLVVCVFGVLLLSACAHSAGSYDPIVPLKQGVSFSHYANLSLVANNDDSVPMTALDRERLLNKIVSRVQIAGIYKTINDGSPQPNTLTATLDVTNYDKGNAFLRFLLAGLGQIHIDGKLTLEDSDKTEQLAKYDVNKTFAWGGIHGGTTNIETVEEGFAETVAEILLEKDKKTQ